MRPFSHFRSFAGACAALLLLLAIAPQIYARGADASVSARALPAEAQHTLALIRAGGPFPYSRDGITFSNREHLLPVERKSYYREYTVQTPGARDRGARRIVRGARGEFYYSDDHYQSFTRIVE